MPRKLDGGAAIQVFRQYIPTIQALRGRRESGRLGAASDPKSLSRGFDSLGPLHETECQAFVSSTTFTG